MMRAGLYLGPVDLTLLVALRKKALNMVTIAKKVPMKAMHKPEASTGLMIICFPRGLVR
jgi:hypothetical protein